MRGPDDGFTAIFDLWKFCITGGIVDVAFCNGDSCVRMFFMKTTLVQMDLMTVVEGIGRSDTRFDGIVDFSDTRKSLLNAFALPFELFGVS